MRNRAVIVDQIDYWIRRHAIRASCGTHPAQNKSKLDPARDRLVGLSAIGQSLKDHYDALAPPIPPHLAALVEQLKPRGTRGSLSVVATVDEWNRNTPAVHPRGRSAKLPGRPLRVIERPLAEQARNRDHDSRDECEQARKQHKVSQEHTHSRASPSSPLCGLMLASQSSSGNEIKKHLFWSVTCTLRRSASIRQITSWLVVLFFIDREGTRDSRRRCHCGPSRS